VLVVTRGKVLGRGYRSGVGVVRVLAEGMGGC
jgi:hypothetical protein